MPELVFIHWKAVILVEASGQKGVVYIAPQVKIGFIAIPDISAKAGERFIKMKACEKSVLPLQTDRRNKLFMIPCCNNKIAGFHINDCIFIHHLTLHTVILHYILFKSCLIQVFSSQRNVFR